MSEVPGNDRLIAGRYRLLGPLGEGGMGVVWRARDEVLGREVAVKEVRAPASLPAADAERLHARLEREAWAAARISHRNVVTVYDVATEDARPWIVMELIRGLALSDVLDAEGPMPPRRAARIGAEVLAALRGAHAAGVLHRDVKPGNVLLANDGRVVLTDFGIAMVEGSPALTMTGELIGSPEFLAPERALGRTPGPESDLWSLGVLLYAATEGYSPFRQNTPLSTLRAVVDEELPPPRRAGALTSVIEGLLRKDPAERLTAEEAEHRLRVIAAGGGTAPTGSGPTSPTVTAGTPLPAGGGGGGARAVGGGAGTPATPVPLRPPAPGASARPSRAGMLLAAGVAVLLLAAGGLAWSLADNNDPGGRQAQDGSANPGTTTSAPGPGASTPHSSGEGTRKGDSGEGGSAGTTTGGSGHTGGTARPPQSVKVHLATVRGSYKGSCPASHDAAPAVEGTVTVGRTPVAVRYRWVLKDGTSSDPDWKSLHFASGGPRAKQVSHTELTYTPDAPYHGEIRLEVQSPVAVTSNGVEFSVICEEETPTDEVSYPASD